VSVGRQWVDGANRSLGISLPIAPGSHLGMVKEVLNESLMIDRPREEELHKKKAMGVPIVNRGRWEGNGSTKGERRTRN